MSISRINRFVAAAVAAFLVTPAVAQDQTEYLEEIVVTSTKRQTTLQETPVAVSVISADILQKSGIQDIKDLQFLVPSLRVTQLQSSGNTNFLIRGFGNGANNAGIEPSVGVFIDGVYRSRTASALADLPNLQRIEVLRGPQSTLFGKNASAGVISVITEKPSLDGTSGSATITVGDYGQFIVKSDITGPLSDTVAFSLSGSTNQRDGYYENLAGGDALGEINRWGVRGQLLYAPTDTFEMRIIADYDDLDEACCGVANLRDGPTGAIVRGLGGNLVSNSPFAYAGYYDFTPVNQFQTDGVSMQIDYDFNDVTFTSISALRDLSRFDNVDVDFTSAELLDPDTGNLTDTEIDTLTQEFRFSGSGDQASWMIGMFMFHEDVEQFTNVQFGSQFRPYADLASIGAFNRSTAVNNVARADAGLPPEPFLMPGVDPSPVDDLEFALGLPYGTFFADGQGVNEQSSMKNRSVSLFAQTDIDLGDSATLTLGINYTEDEKKVLFDSTATDLFAQVDLVDVGGQLLYAGFYQAAFAGVIPGVPGGDADIANAFATGVAAATAPVECPSPQTYPDETLCNPVLGLQELQFLYPNVDFPNSVESGTTKDDDLSWTVRLAIDVTDDVNMYVSAATGFKASSWNLSRDSRPFPKDQAAIEAAGLSVPNLYYTTRYAAPEEATVYEIGLKARWDTVSLNMAIFDQEIENFQENIFTGVGFTLQNAGLQSSTGLEFDLLWAPSDAFQASLAATFMDPVYDSFVNAESVDPVTFEDITEDISGQQVAGVHELSLTASGIYNFAVGSADGYVRAEYIYEDKIRVIQNTPENLASREVGTLNASIGLAWENGFEANIWGRNITDDEYLLSAFPAVAQAGSFSGYPNQPRTFGLTVRKYFD